MYFRQFYGSIRTEAQSYANRKTVEERHGTRTYTQGWYSSIVCKQKTNRFCERDITGGLNGIIQTFQKGLRHSDRLKERRTSIRQKTTTCVFSYCMTIP